MLLAFLDGFFIVIAKLPGRQGGHNSQCRERAHVLPLPPVAGGTVTQVPDFKFLIAEERMRAYLGPEMTRAAEALT